MTQSAQPDGQETVTLTIDDQQITVPKGTLIIRAAEQLGIEVPRFCDHPLLDPVAWCRQCMVEVEGQRKPQPSCAVAAADGMVVRTQHTSAEADRAQHLVMELLLINHPLDCPTCDKGGECPLQNQAMAHGRSETRFEEAKRHYPKPINISAQVLLDRDRCILCARCTRFANEIAGDKLIEMMDRGALQQVGIYSDTPFDSYFSGNTVQICPVGALTGASYRFRARPFDLVSTPSVCEHCASGCAQRTDHRRGKVMRRLAGDDPDVNEEWNCDKGRWAFTYATQSDRITTPLVRDDSGNLVPTSWPHAAAVVARGLAAARGHTGVLVGGRMSAEDAYSYAKFARLALHSDDIDFRARAHSAEEAAFLAARVAGRGIEVSYADLAAAPVVLLAGLEPEEESPIVFLRLRKAARKNTTQVISVAPLADRGLAKMSGTLLPVVPGGEAAALDDLHTADIGQSLRQPGAVILVGERLASSPGALSAAVRLAEATGAKLAWVPRRAGERGALDSGALAGLLPGGRPLEDPGARAEVARAWGLDGPDGLPSQAGRTTDAILAAAGDGTLQALLVGGVEPADLADPAAALAALDAVGFLVSLEQRHSEVTERADVVLPVAVAAEKAGTYVNWEGRHRRFGVALGDSGALPDRRVLDVIAEEMGVPLGLSTLEAAREELAALRSWAGDRPAGPDVAAGPPPQPGSGEAVLAGWRMLLDEGRLQAGERNLAATARTPVARLSATTAADIGAAAGDPITVSTERGRITLPLAITDMPDNVVWLPMNSAGSAVHRDLGVSPGATVQIGRTP
ncbi:NADH-quinone oxidoreductase subunit G [Mycolicibacter hiberniae]|uniref:NADH-quinone oxidoreductase n=1 Tax=Mycolicibacter hiberniae TaxID=29314 RepID=A0A7I7X2N2_9MYCO|nr:NADH-quinone oxidoreductase subunit G [Mycolicibacter hiberniae]MCV7088121.1 NADH-quinone oxidoreductase subunit G [Mycolicibacter hiberniae]ORV72446.1 NADH-quinone oxidoreductase subunit G [Mycolicibacter hiberniae]BBZ23864.1 NADH-quinone oxidoreductase subunit G [Mycolicibacter hiberniae]